MQPQPADKKAVVEAEFLANMTHEVRTPLNGIIAMTELVLSMELGPRQREYLCMVKSSAEALLAMLNDVLDLSKAEAGKMLLHPVPFSLRQLFDEVLRPVAVLASANQVELVYGVDAAAPEELFADPLRLRQVLQNLVGNALKFTEKGRIEVRAELEASEGDKLVLKFTVRDTGIGIPKEQQRSIFEPFTQADGSTTRRYGGTGLGLSIASRLVELMHGRIWVESEPGQGSRFYFTAQAKRVLREPIRVPDAEAGPGAHVLVVDDDAVNRSFVEAALRDAGYDVSSVATGSEAMAVAQSTPIDVALVDIHMPGMDGFETARGLRASRGTPRIIAMSASPVGRVLERATSAGINACLAKPLSFAELRQAVGRALAPPLAPTLKLDLALSRVGGDRQLLAELAGLFLGEFPGLLDKLRVAVAQGDAQDVETHAHSLKGSAANFGADRTSGYALHLEQMGRERDLAGASDILSALEHSLESVRPELEALARDA